MGSDRWENEGPPGEAYSRVTNPHRFAPLHQIAAQLLERLEVEFEVDRTQEHHLDDELEKGFVLARPSIRLQPTAQAAAAPLTVAFSAFPGLHVRFGHWCMMAFPTCGCDACNETIEDEVERLSRFVADLTAGRFREAIRFPAQQSARTEWEFWSAGGGFARQSSRLQRDRASLLNPAEGDSFHEWHPWRRRL